MSLDALSYSSLIDLVERELATKSLALDRFGEVRADLRNAVIRLSLCRAVMRLVTAERLGQALEFRVVNFEALLSAGETLLLEIPDDEERVLKLEVVSERVIAECASLVMAFGPELQNRWRFGLEILSRLTRTPGALSRLRSMVIG